MNYPKQIIIQDLKEKLSDNLEDNLKEVILFGSQLNDSSISESDYDILIILKCNSDWKLERKISDICYEIELKYGILTDTHILSEQELDSPRGKQPVFQNAIREGFYV